MPPIWRKTERVVSMHDFMIEARDLEYFQGKGDAIYQVVGSEGDELIFTLLDEKRGFKALNLIKVFNAYENLTMFNSSSLMPYISQNLHAAARGLLLELKLLVQYDFV